MKIVRRCGPAPVWTSGGWSTMANLYEAHSEFLEEEGPNADPEFDMTLVYEVGNAPAIFLNVRSIDFKEVK